MRFIPGYDDWLRHANFMMWNSRSNNRFGGTSSKIRKRALCDPHFALKDMLLEGRRDEQSTYQAKDIESKDVTDAETNKIAM